MGEPTNVSPLKIEQSKEESPNIAVGPTAGDNISLATTDEMSIHLSPQPLLQSNKTQELSPVSAKSAKKIPSAGRVKTILNKSQNVKMSSGPKTSTPRTSAKEKKQLQRVKAKVNENVPTERCDMCEQNKVMLARCLNCQASMCGECTDHHRRMKLTNTHELQNWDKFMHQIPPTPQPSLGPTCTIHKDETLKFYCKICCQPLCTACKLTKHEGHKTRDLKVEIAEQRENLPFKLSQIRASFLPQLKQQIQNLDEQNKLIANNVKRTIENVQKRSRVMKEEIDHTSNKLVEKLKTKEKRENSKLEEKRRAISNYIRNATTALTSGERIAQNGNDFEVMELYQKLMNLSKQIQALQKKKPMKVQYSFKDGQMSSAQLESMFGGYQENGGQENTTKSTNKSKTPRSSRSVPSIQIVPELRARLLTSFTCKSVPGNKVSVIAPINETEAWLCFGWATNEIYLYNKDGFRIKRLVFKQAVDDIAVDKNGNLVVSTFTGSVVRLVDRTFQVRDFFQCPLRCRGLDVSAAGDIIVCGVDMCTAMPPPKKCTIFKFTARGNKTGHLDGDKGKRIPVHPYRVAENIDGSIAVADWISDKEGRVVVFSHDGKIRMVYYGKHFERKNNFLPYGICTDKFGHIIVGDVVNREVHLLDIKGHFLMVLLSKEDLDNERPYSVAVDHMGLLWVGNERAQIKIFRYLLHQPHLVGPFLPGKDSTWKNDPYKHNPYKHSPYISPRDVYYEGSPMYYPYLEYPINTVNHWKRKEPKRPVKVFRDIPDIKWKVPY